MSKFCNLFYTLTFKAILFTLVTVFAWFSGSYTLQAFDLYFEDSVSYTNVMVQWNNFEYESSEYVRSEVETAIDNIISFYFDYMDKNEKRSLSYFGRKDIPLENYTHVIKDDYKQSLEYLNSLEDVSFAIVNHNNKTIFSNIISLDGKSSGTHVRTFFGNNDSTVLIVRNAKNPYYEKGTMSEYVDYVSECAASHSDNFDLYICFGDDLLFRFDAGHYESLHTVMKEKIIGIYNPMILFSFLTIAVLSVLTILSGKSEKGGKISPAALDRTPNDLRFALHLIILISLVTVFDDYIYMLHLGFRSGGDYFLGISPDFYKTIANICIVVLTYVILAMSCTIKRQSRLGTLFRNTYVYRIFSTLLKKDRQNENT